MYKYIILIIIILVIININKNQIIKENFTTDEEQKIKTYINDIYKADIEATRNLSNYASYLMGTNSITAPGTIKSTSNICVNDKCLDQNDISKLLNYTKNNKLSDQVNIGDNWTIGAQAGALDAGFEIKRKDRPSNEVGYYRFDHTGQFNYIVNYNDQKVNYSDIMFDLLNTQSGSINTGPIWGEGDIQTVTFNKAFKVLTPTVYVATDYLVNNEDINNKLWLQLWANKNVTKTGFTVTTWVTNNAKGPEKRSRIKWLAVAVWNTNDSNNPQITQPNAF